MELREELEGHQRKFEKLLKAPLRGALEEQVQ